MAAPLAAITERAHAKVNLSLRVLGRRADGYHELLSLVAFAETAYDTLSLEPGAPEGLVVGGETADSLAGGPENLVLRAVAAARAAKPGLRAGRLTLDKRLPVAAGIGGGSADGAAALRLLRRANTDAADIDWHRIASSIGADVPVCLTGRAAMMWGLGEHVEALDHFPPAWVVLANPRVGLGTADVFRALGAPPLAVAPGIPGKPDVTTAADLAEWLRERPNDLEAPAVRLCPAIDGVRRALGTLDGALLARMSGSGATCFALFTSASNAAAGARALAAAEPGWWVAQSRLI
ncbi:MAG: 4-(cytidine 5'-diphospho)-2-C-methyl-D-erythritol kinase [Hyphomicrobiaceae bacterium]